MMDVDMTTLHQMFTNPSVDFQQCLDAVKMTLVFFAHKDFFCDRLQEEGN